MTGLAGADLILSIHPKIQTMLLEPGVPRRAGIDEPVDPQVIKRLQRLPEFNRAYEPDGMRPEEFISYGLTQRTLTQFYDSAWVMLENYKF